MTNRDETFDCDTNTMKDLNENRIGKVENKNATMGLSNLKRSDKTFEIDNISNAGIQLENSSQAKEQKVSSSQNTVSLCDMVDIHEQKANNLTDDKKEDKTNAAADEESTDGEIRLGCDQVEGKKSNIQPDKHDIPDESKTNGTDKQRWKPLDFCMKKCCISKDELSHVIQTLLLDYTLMLILQSVFTDEPMKKINLTARWLLTSDCEIFDIIVYAIPYIPGNLGLHIWDNTEIVRKILRDTMLRRVWLETEPFRLATFSLLRGLFPQVNSLHLAREGFFCDNDGRILCYRCNRSYSTDNAEVHQLDCRAYENTSEIMVDYGAQASGYIVPSSYRGHLNLRANGMVRPLLALGQTRPFMLTRENISSEAAGRTISLRSRRICVQESDRSASPNFPDPYIPHQYPIMESTDEPPTVNHHRRIRNRNIWDRSNTSTSELALTYASSLSRELSHDAVFEPVHQNANQTFNLVPGEQRHAVCFPPSQESVMRNGDNLRIIPNHNGSPDRLFSLSTRNYASSCTRNNDVPPQLQDLDDRNGNISAQMLTYGEASTTNPCMTMTNIRSHVRYQRPTVQEFTERRNTSQYKQRSNAIPSEQLEENMTQTGAETTPRTNISSENVNRISKKSLPRTHQLRDHLSERSKSPRTDISAGAAETQNDNFQLDANQSENPNKSDKDYSAVAQQMPCNENLQARMPTGLPKAQQNNKSRKVMPGREHPTKVQEHLSNSYLQAEPRQVIDPGIMETTINNNPQTIRDPNTSSVVPEVFSLLHMQNNRANKKFRKKSEASTTNGNMFEDMNGESGAPPNAQDTDDRSRCYKCGNILKYETENNNTAGQPAKCHPPCQ